MSTSQIPASCIVCGTALKQDATPLSDLDAYLLQCIRCGNYAATTTLTEDRLPDIKAEERAALSAALRDAHERRQDLLLSTTNWKQLVASFSNLTIPEKLRRIIEYLGRKSGTRAGVEIRISDQMDFPLFGAADTHEYNWLRRTLVAQKLISERGPENLTLTLEGWEAFRPARGGTPGTCFVAMAFEKVLDEAYDHGIKPAVEDNHFTVTRLDRVQHNENINDRIIVDIRACEFMVADFTMHKNGVYFEAGFAKGLGREVIWTCRRDQMPNAHFDTRPYNHVIWDEPADLRKNLAVRIAATIVK